MVLSMEVYINETTKIPAEAVINVAQMIGLKTEIKKQVLSIQKEGWFKRRNDILGFCLGTVTDKGPKVVALNNDGKQAVYNIACGLCIPIEYCCISSHMGLRMTDLFVANPNGTITL